MPPSRATGPRLLVVRPPEGTVPAGGTVLPEGTVPGAGGGRAAYPVVAFGHGFLQRPWRYRGLMTALAGHGFLVVAPDTQAGPLPRHRALADDLWRAVEWARANEPHAHPDLAAAVGHSMGAGCALLGATRWPGFRAVATLAALDTRPSMLPALGSLQVPSLFVVGTADTVVPPARTRAVYAATAGSPAWLEIPGGGHCGVLDSAFPRGVACGGQELDPTRQLVTSALSVGTWLAEMLRN